MKNITEEYEFLNNKEKEIKIINKEEDSINNDVKNFLWISK